MPTLLAIDDDDTILHTVRRIFDNSDDVALVTASSAKEGLQMVAQRQPDAVLLDVVLPDMEGLETFQRIHELDSTIPVIFITSGVTGDTVIEAMRQGAYDFLKAFIAFIGSEIADA